MKNKFIAIAIFCLLALGLRAEETTLELKKEELREQNGKILFEPDRRVQRAKYDTYVFDKKEFTTKIGAIKGLPENVSVVVNIKPGTISSVNPTKGAAPVGGIKIRYYEASIVKKQ